MNNISYTTTTFYDEIEFTVDLLKKLLSIITDSFIVSIFKDHFVESFMEEDDGILTDFFFPLQLVLLKSLGFILKKDERAEELKKCIKDAFKKIIPACMFV